MARSNKPITYGKSPAADDTDDLKYITDNQ
jgi:hypothetical protein